MDHNTTQSTATATATASTDNRGAGGKLTRPTRSRPSATPYSRPQRQTEPGRGRWLLSKVVGGATRVVSSFFSTRPPSVDDDDDHEEEEEQFNVVDVDELQNDEETTLNIEESRVDQAGPSSVIGGCSDGSGQKQLEKDHGVSQIEQLVKGKTFSKDEIDRLMEIIRSRAANPPDVEPENKGFSLSGAKDTKLRVTFDIPRLSLDEKHEEAHRSVWGTSTPVRQSTPKTIFENARPFEEKTIPGTSTPIPQLASKVTFDNPGKLFEEQEDLNHTTWGISTPFPHSAVRDKIGASPIDIAKAYMGARRSEVSINRNNIVLKDVKVSEHGDESVSKQFIPSPSPKPSTCWPGAMIQDRRDYTTPLSQRGRFGPRKFSHTPYSRSVYTKDSIPKQSRNNIVDNDHGSVGPIRSTRRKASAITPSGTPVYSHSSLKRPSHVDYSNNSPERLFSSTKNYFQTEGTRDNASMFQRADDKSQRSEPRTANIHPHSSQMARTILEHLERNIPTPKDKSDELKLAVSWKNPPSADLSTVTSNDYNALQILGDDVGKKMDESVQKMGSFPPLKNVFAGNGSVNETKLAVISTICGSGTATIHGENVVRDFSDTQKSQLTGPNKDKTNVTVNAMDSDVPKLANASTRTSGNNNKPLLSSITIGNPVKKWAFSPINSSGFTFPVSASSTLLSEPPTPSIMPSAANCSPPQPSKEDPTFSFGSRMSTPPLVFSFPSTSSAPIQDDDSDIKFNFGSDKSTRISFSLVGKDALCY